MLTVEASATVRKITGHESLLCPGFYRGAVRGHTDALFLVTPDKHIVFLYDFAHGRSLDLGGATIQPATTRDMVCVRPVDIHMTVTE